MLLEGSNGQGVEGVGTDGFKLHRDHGGHALHLDTNQAGFGWGLATETPESGGHFCDEDIFDEVGGLPSFEMDFDEFLKFGKFFTGEHEVPRVSAVGGGVEAGAPFAFGGFGACGFQRVEARGLFAFVVCFHVGYRIPDGLEVAMVKCFRILAKWLGTRIFSGSEITDLWPLIHADSRG